MSFEKRWCLSLLPFCLIVASASVARAEEPAKGELKGLRIIVPEARGVVHKDLTRAARRDLKNAGAMVISAAKLRAAAAKLNIPVPQQGEPAKLAEACRAVPAAYVLRTEITRRGWLYAAQALLVDCTNGEIKMDFRSEYYKPEQEAKDRGSRIGRKAVQKLAFLIGPPLVPPVGTGTMAVARKDTKQGGETTGGTQEGGQKPPDQGTSGGQTGGTGGETSGGSTGGSSGGEASGGSSGGTNDLGLTTAEVDALAGEGGWQWNIRGWVGTYYSAFLNSAVDANKDRNFAKAGIRDTLTGKFGESLRLRVLPLVEIDLLKSRLHRVDLEEGFLEYSKGFVEFRLGWDALSWGAASTLNIVDVINTRDFTEGIVDAPKIGQPMLSTRFLFGDHSFTLMYLTPFVQPKLPRLDTVFNPFALPATIDPNKFGNSVLYASKYNEWQPQAAARLALAFGTVEIRGSYFYGYERFPLVHLPTATLFFPLIHHLSTDGQVIIDKTSITWEAASVWHVKTDNSKNPPLTLSDGQMASEILQPGQRFTWIIGLEHTLDNVLTPGSLVLIAEFLGDSSSRWFTNQRPPDDATLFFENNLIYGIRWTFDNRVDSKISIIDIADLTHAGDHYVSAEYSERWFSNFTFLMGARWGFANEADKMAPLRQLSGLYTQLRLNY